mmetsp:Transcript_11229/g.10850  ORF Transcript_11229/g.10850 Transcript_11229/m.10850 type:complete len:84 (+) Transcript_11229:280-531(+)
MHIYIYTMNTKGGGYIELSPLTTYLTIFLIPLQREECMLYTPLSVCYIFLSFSSLSLRIGELSLEGELPWELIPLELILYKGL